MSEEPYYVSMLLDVLEHQTSDKDRLSAFIQENGLSISIGTSDARYNAGKRRVMMTTCDARQLLNLGIFPVAISDLIKDLIDGQQ